MDHRQPVRVPANVERQVGAARADHVGRAVRVDVDGNRIGDEALGGPQAQLDAGRHLDVDLLPRFRGERRRLGCRQPDLPRSLGATSGDGLTADGGGAAEDSDDDKAAPVDDRSLLWAHGA